jgi:hypothetical protein
MTTQKKTLLKKTKQTLELEKIGKTRKRDVINNEQKRDWEYQLKDFKRKQDGN